MTEQHEEESLRRWAREQAEIERQTDALVLRTLTAMVTAAEDLKSKLRRDTESMLEEYRKSKRALENEISLSTAERQRFRREVEQERESIVADANVQAREIVEAAEREREQLLRETRMMEQRLRGIEGQIRDLFGQTTAPSDAPPGAAAPATVTPAAPAAPIPTTPAPTPSAPAAAAAAPSRDFTPATFERAGATPPAPVTPTPSVDEDDDEDEVAESAFVEDEAELVDDVDEDEDEPPTAATPSHPFTPAPPPPVVAAPPAPAPSAPAPVSAARAQQRRLVELVFDGVPGYQQASALERAVDDLVPDGEVDILDFERGQLVLNVQATDLDALAEQLVATSTAVLLELESVEADRATFHCS
ncbi:MAG: hypothetical protein IT306_27365 [Chloroflexi bacterium]|nr:hypothetical protein [Chloroflexota bacterium]